MFSIPSVAPLVSGIPGFLQPFLEGFQHFARGNRWRREGEFFHGAGLGLFYSSSHQIFPIILKGKAQRLYLSPFCGWVH